MDRSLKFDRMIFLGNGASSMSEVRRLHLLVDEAITLMCGLQQGPWDDSVSDLIDDLRTYVHWMIQAFGYEVEWHDLRELRDP